MGKNNKKIKVLVTSAGSTNGVNIILALRKQKELPLRIVAADTNSLAAGFYLADKYYVVPKADSPVFVSNILKICRKEKIDIIIPNHSFELPFFAKNKSIFEKEKIKIPISSYQTYLITENKLKTNEYFEKWGIPFPRIYNQEDVKNKLVKFPVVIKPIKGSGSQGVLKINSWEELDFFTNYFKKIIIQEYAQGDEYTIDGICDLEGNIIGVLPRVRLEVKGGLAVKAIAKKENLIIHFVEKIIKGFRLEGFNIIGPFNIQCFKNNEKVKFIEVNNRFPSGGLPLAIASGLNIPLILIKLLLGERIKKPKLKYNLLMTRYWDSIILKKKGKKYKVL